MTPRLTAATLVGAMIRRVAGQGGHGTVVAKGDATSGAILLLLAERGTPRRLLERVLGLDDRYVWTAAGPDDPAEFDPYLARRRARDPDLWIVELDGDSAEATAADLP